MDANISFASHQTLLDDSEPQPEASFRKVILQSFPIGPGRKLKRCGRKRLYSNILRDHAAKRNGLFRITAIGSSNRFAAPIFWSHGGFSPVRRTTSANVVLSLDILLCKTRDKQTKEKREKKE
jgi:hypothetical protein